MRKIDLHIHTTYSDGVCSPKEIIEKAHQLGLHVIAITDHDCVKGCRQGQYYANKYGIELIPGVEISTYYKDYEVHILAYFIDVKNRKLKNMLGFLQTGRYRRAEEILKKLNKFGITMNIKDIYKQSAKTGVIGRPHIANAMVEAGYIKDYNDAFSNYIGNESPAYVPKPSYTPEEVINIIHNAEGAAILAHPGILNNDFLIPDLIDMGLDGIEAFYPLHSSGQRDTYLMLAEKYNLLVTGGSDFHGINTSHDVLGKVTLKEKYFQKLKDYCEAKPTVR
jgi:hypothetical protein